MKTLVIYYSRSGTTEKLALAIAKAFDADLERVIDDVDREGAAGFLRSLRDAVRHRDTTIEPLAHDVSKYDLVIIGTPDWGQAVAAPARAVLAQCRERLHHVAFFLTDGVADHAKIFREMAELCGHEPVAVLGIPGKQVNEGHYDEAVATFANTIRKSARPRSAARLEHWMVSDE